MRRLIGAAALVGACHASSALAAEAQTKASAFNRDRNVAVRERTHPEYQPLGVRLGAFQSFPTVALDLEHTDNVFATDAGSRADTIFRLRPEATLRSIWSRHELDLGASASVNRFARSGSENSADVNVFANGRLDVVGNSYLIGGAAYDYATVPRTSADTPGDAAEPVRYQTFRVNGGGAYELNRLRFIVLGDATRFDYANPDAVGGGKVFVQDRDRTLLSVSGKAEYALTPGTALYLIASANKRDYRLDPPAVTLNRDSDGAEIDLGANFDLARLARGEIQFGYLVQNYDAAGAPPVKGVGAKVSVEYFPTQLITMTFKGRRGIDDSGLPGAAGILATQGSVQADYELRRNLILTGLVGRTDDSYRGLDRDDKRTTATLSATYLMNRRLSWYLAFTRYEQTSSGTDQGTDFTDNRLLISAKLHY